MDHTATRGCPLLIRKRSLSTTLAASVGKRRSSALPTPPGWLPLDQAAALGISRQTVLPKVHRGELAAVLVNRGQRQGLRIKVRHDQAGLFDTPR